MTDTPRRWSFRARLTALIAAVFVTGGAVLLIVQYALVQGLFSSAIDGITGCVDDGTGGTVITGSRPPGGDDCTEITGSSDASGGSHVIVGTDGERVLIEQTTTLSHEVLSGLLLWSVVTLLIFTILAIFAASWLSRRSFARIGRITETTQRISRHGLNQRLALPGPADEIKELGDTIDTMLDGLEAAFIQQERFITNASHELRTPLTTARTALEIPLAQGRVPVHLEPAIQRALDANQRSEHLLAALLQLASMTHAGRSPSEHGYARIALAPIIGHILAEREDEVERRQLTVTTEIPSDTATSADRTLLGLAIDNLIDNAIRHNVDHGALHISAGETAGATYVEITNSGPEFTADESARLVEPFNRGPQTRIVTGGRSLGLGLTLVQNIIDSMGATLSLKPGPAGGLIARVCFP